MKEFCIIFSLLVLSQSGYSKPTCLSSRQPNIDFFQIKVYHLKSDEQVKMTDDFLKDAYLPALHRFGIKNIGVFKPISNDTASVKLIYVLIPFSSCSGWMKISKRVESDQMFRSAAESFLHASSTDPPYERMESILLEAFPKQPFLLLPKHKSREQVFELRSYESPTEHLAERKIDMINTDEVDLFNRLGFNPVFYGKVISGSRMPNLMYLPVFKSVEDRNAQWKVFVADAKWKEISTDPKYENKVSVNHIDSILMHSTDYSDY